ncbi:MAG: Hint domain-containing protein [Candidatus Planktophila sp.]
MSASISFTYEYKVTITEPTPGQDFFNVTSGVDRSGIGNSTVAIQDGELNVEIGDTLFKDGTEFTYEGRTTDGIVIKDLDGDYFLLTNAPKAPAGSGEIEPQAYCLLAGTLIPTSDGEKFVEELNVGDLVLNSQGSYSSVRWIGVQTLSPIFSGQASWPVKISKDALGENTPDKDLYVSQDHAIFLQGLLICAEALVNGTTITLEKPTESSFKYYGLDLGPATIHPVHNLPVGSLGAVPRKEFDNYQQWLDSGHELIDEPLMFPRVKNASQLPAQLREEISA